MGKEELFRRFKSGQVELFFIVRSDYEVDLRMDNVFLRKLAESKIAIPGWVAEEEAVRYLSENIREEHDWKVARVSGPSFGRFLESLEPGFRKNLLLDLV